MSQGAAIEVSRFDDWAGGLAAAWQRLFVRLGRIEAGWLAGRLRAIPIDRPIYIAGMARSGSTVLLEMLEQHRETASHRYRDYPFALTPVIWNAFLDRAAKRSMEPVERAHKDRIKITPDSPEAVEEMVWMAFFPHAHDPAVDNVLDATGHHPEFEAFYRDHLRKILLLRGGSRYLAKGNYNLSRLGYLLRLFPDARLVVPVRHPVAQVASLIKQHRLFVAAGRRNPAVLRYLQRLGHFEFGLDRRAVNVGEHGAVERIQGLWQAGEEVRGTAASWASLYGHVAELIERDPRISRQLFIADYDELCRNPGNLLARLFAHCQLDITPGQLATHAARISSPTYYTPKFSVAELAAIREETDEVYQRLCALAGSPPTT
ncbi:sulfotransferase [Endothiovibrio diazotrophicus]